MSYANVTQPTANYVTVIYVMTGLYLSSIRNSLCLGYFNQWQIFICTEIFVLLWQYTPTSQKQDGPVTGW